MTTATMPTPTKTPKAFAVWFKDMERWNVGSFTALDWRWPRKMIRPLSEAITRKSFTVDRKKTDPDAVQLLTLHFDGEIEPRQVRGTKPIKGKLWWADPGDVVYSKIDVRNGAIGIVPEELGGACVTSEYPVYAVDPSVTDAGYIKLVFRTAAFRQKINGMISGASGRKRVQPSDLEAIEVPLPPLPVQQAIVKAWRQAQDEVADTRRRIAELEDKIEADFLAELGLKKPKRGKLPKVFAVQWEDFHRWSLLYNQLSTGGINLREGKYSIQPLESILARVQYGTSTKANTLGKGIPVIRMNNINNGQFDFTDLKHVVLPAHDIKALRLVEGDILVNRTNSKELVGKCAAFHGDADYVFASYLIRLKVYDHLADPDYITYALNSAIGRQQVDMLSRQIGGQANINSEELRSIELPLPPLPIQRRLVAKITAQRDKIAALKAEADQKQQQTKAKVEAMILGTKPVSGQ